MPHTEPRSWLIAYDIADPRRLGRVHRFLKRHAIPVQYSAFVLQANQINLELVLSGIADRIDPACDDIRAYHVPNQCEVKALGRQHLPDGILLRPEQVGRLLRNSTSPFPTVIDETDDTDEC